MKMLIYSDLHLDMHPIDLQVRPELLHTVDVVVLAGDITEGTAGLRWARNTFPNTAIVYVDGNHEFYGQHWEKHIDAMRALAAEREVHYLENDSITIEGVRFLGCSLWTDFALHGVEAKLEAMSAARRRMNDYQLIKISAPQEMYWQRKHRLFPAMAARRHDESRQWLQEQLSQGDPQHTVVVTHHAPHAGSISQKHLGNELSPAYASDLTSLMGKTKLWIHGHIHESVDYQVNSTRVVSNPRGYKFEFGKGMENEAFREDFHLDV